MSIYRQKVMRHYQSPKNRGQLSDASKVFTGANPLCGDEVAFYVKLDDKEVITEVSWDGAGCVISQAAASMFSEMIKGMEFKKARDIDPKELIKKMDVELSPIRRKCALLPLFTIREQEMSVE